MYCERLYSRDVFFNANYYASGHEQYLCIFYYHDKNIIAGAAYETAVVGSNKAREKPDSQTGSGDRSGTDVAELETLFQSRVNGKCILLSTIQGQVTVEGDEVCVRAQGTWRKMKVSVEKRAVITEPEKKLRDIKKIKEFVNGTQDYDRRVSPLYRGLSK